MALTGTASKQVMMRSASSEWLFEFIIVVFLERDGAENASPSSLHANNVIDVIGRFLNMGVEPYNFVSSLNCVLAQRLVRVLCNVFRRAFHPTDIELIESGLRPEEHRDRVFYANAGCDACNHTGYRGRTAIHELLDLSDNIREMIVERRPGSEVRRAAEAEGLTSLRESALKKVFAGVSTLHEINRVTFVEEVNLNAHV